MADERLDHSVDSPWKGEHYFRYEWILKEIDPDDRVLDIACGQGYGTFLISGKTHNLVFGGDISPEAVAGCTHNWKRDNLEFRVMDGTDLAFEPGFFDKIVSFETIEHTTEYAAMLRELYRVLRPGGIAFISTPNILINSPSGSVENPFHTQEWELHELEDILSSAFDHVEIYGQKYSRFDDPAVSSVGKIAEQLLNQRVIRRLPIGFKDRVSTALINKPFYPRTDDFTLVSKRAEIVECQTFFCVCTKSKA